MKILPAFLVISLFFITALSAKEKEEQLNLAVGEGKLQTVKKLIAEGADVNAGFNGSIPLYIASISLFDDIVEALLEAGADPNILNTDKDSALSASLSGPLMVSQQKSFQDLMASVNGSPEGSEVVGIITRLQRGEPIGNITAREKALIQKVMPMSNDPDEESLKKCHRIVKLLLEHKADVNHQTVLGQTPLHHVMHLKSPAIFETLMKYKPKLNGKTLNGGTPLLLAISSGSLGMVKKLIDSGADVHAVNGLFYGVLHCAAKQDNPEVVEYLLKKKLPVDNQSSSGHTALHLAVEYGHAKVANSLIKAGCKVNTTSRFESSPLSVSAARGLVGVVRNLISAGARIEDPVLFSASAMGQYRVLEVLIENGVNIDAVDEFGNTALHYVLKVKQEAELKLAGAVHNSYETVKVLIGAGIKVNAVGKDGVTALNYAVKANLPQVVELLLKSGANINTRDHLNKTPINLAIEHDSALSAEQLILKGVKLKSARLGSSTPIQMATFWKRKVILAMMTAKENNIPNWALNYSFGNAENDVAVVSGQRISASQALAFAGGYDKLFSDLSFESTSDVSALTAEYKDIRQTMQMSAKALAELAMIYEMFKNKVTVDAKDLEVQQAKLLAIMGFGVEASSQETRDIAQNNALRKHALLDKEFKIIVNWMATREKVGAIYGKSLKIQKPEVEAYYRENQEGFITVKEVRVEVIAVKAAGKINSIIKEYREGRDFAELAKQESVLPSASSGGDFGWKKRADLSSFVLKAITGVKVGGLSKPIEVQGLIYLFRVREAKASSFKSLEDVAEVIHETLVSTKQEEYLSSLVTESMQKEKVQFFFN